MVSPFTTNTRPSKSLFQSRSWVCKEDEGNGINFYHAKGWNYEQLNDIFEQATEEARKTHTPSLFTLLK